MSTDPTARTALYDELLRRFASGVRAAQLYAAEHPLLARNIEGLLTALKALHQHSPSVPIGIVGNELRRRRHANGKTSAGMTELIKRLRDHKIERIAFERGITSAEAGIFVQAVAALGNRADARLSGRYSRPTSVSDASPRTGADGGIVSDMAAIRQLYSSAVRGGRDGLGERESEGVCRTCRRRCRRSKGWRMPSRQNRTALMALTAMRNYDNYTFTHMVNVSILTMGQARALGIEGTSAARVRAVGADARHRQGTHAKGDSEQARQADRRRVRDHAEAHGRWRGDSASNARDADPRAGRRVRASSPPRPERLPVRRQARRAERGDRCCAASRTSTMRCARSAPTSRRFRRIGSSRFSSATTAHNSINTSCAVSSSCSVFIRLATS